MEVKGAHSGGEGRVMIGQAAEARGPCGSLVCFPLLHTLSL